MEYSILDFLKTFGINTKTNFDLKEHADFLNLKLKVLMNNELYKIKNTKKHNVIINLQNSDKKGSHWVCIKDRKYYFDPYGIKPTKEVENFLDRSNGSREDPDENYSYNTLQVQPNETKICGILCLYMLYKLEKGDNFVDIILEIHEELENLL